MPRPPDPLFAHRNLPLLLLRAREGVLAHFRPLLKAAGLTEQQWRVVRALVEVGPLEPRQIVQLCGISSPSLAGVLARMDELGLVHRERFDHDARRVRVTATARSRDIAQQLAPKIEAVYGALVADLGEGFVERLYDALDTLLQTVGPGDEVEVD